MPSFTDSFWSSDYAGGLGVLFGKLQQGVIENQQVLQIAKLRADAEDTYGSRLEGIPGTSDRAGGFSRDDGASVKKAFDGVRKEMEEAGSNHRKVASNIRKLVIEPFSRWCDAHESRVTDSHDDLQARIKALDKQSDLVKKLRSAYFNKCRLLEDLEEETKFAFQSPTAPTDSPSSATATTTPQIVLPTPAPGEEDDEPLEIGDLYYQPAEVKAFLTDMLNTIPLGEHKVAILGTYQNVSTGDQITSYIMEKMNATSVSHAERIGQDLVNHGLLRLIGQVGNTFANSSKMNYQWKDKAFEKSGVPKKKADMKRTATLNGDGGDTPITAVVGDYVSNLMGNAHPNETPGDRLRREAHEADDRYKAGVRKLDLMRCNLEEAMMNHLRFMEQCELDRLKAIKAVMLDFASAISNVVPAIQKTVDNMMLYQETIQPTGDLRYMLESYRTGSFVPKVVTYESYYNSVDDQTFGVDLEARARADRKRVPLIVTTLLTYLDHHYPDLEGDEARRQIWLMNVPLEATHHLRNKINNGGAIAEELLAEYEMPIVASVLKLYLLELPDPIVSSTKYDIIKTVYTTHGQEDDDKARLSVIQNTLAGLPLTNIATLDAITTHFTRLIELTSADEPYISSLAHSLANSILRPRVESPLTQHERHSYRLVRDLFAHKDQIFGELKRASTVASGRARATSSTDERSRREAQEARARAVIARSRPSSPAPPTNRHKREPSSVDSSATRFPVAVANSSPTGQRKYRPSSLEVPDAAPPPVPRPDSPPSEEEPSPPRSHTPTGSLSGGGVEKRNSLGRTTHASGARFGKGRPQSLVRAVQGGRRESSDEGREGRGESQGRYSLSDRPMDD